VKTVNISGNICKFDDDADVSNLSVCTKPDGYKTLVYSAGTYKTKLYCRVYMNCPKSMEIDHRDGDTLNNTTENLRIVTSQQNKFNRKTKNGKLKGIEKRGNSYRVTITIDYTKYNLGTYVNEELAIAAYQEAAEKYFKEYAEHISRIRSQK
jgi:hypothetical protein